MTLPFLYVIGCAGMVAMLCRRRFEEVLPLALMGSAFALYASGLAFGSVWPGYAVCVLFALGMPVWLGVLALRALRARGVAARGRQGITASMTTQAMQPEMEHTQANVAEPIGKAGLKQEAPAQAALVKAIAAQATPAQAALRAALAQLITPAFFIFCALGAVVFLLDWNKGFHMWDEYSHWGPMARETLRLDALYTSPLARDFVHPDYPPLVCLFETLWAKLAGGYREAYLYRGLHVLSFSLLFPALTRLRWPRVAGLPCWQRVKKGAGFALFCVGVLALLVTLPLCVELEDGGFYSTIYLDCLLGLLLAYGVFLVLDAKRWGAFELVRLGIALGFLLLTKQMGLAFYALILGVFVVDFIIVRRGCLLGLLGAHSAQNGQDKQAKHAALVAQGKPATQQRKHSAQAMLRAVPRALWGRLAGALCALGVVPLLLAKLWSWHVAAQGLAQQFSMGSVPWAQVIADVQGVGTQPWKQQVLASYFEALGTYRIVVWGKLPVPYWALTLLFVAFFLLAAWGGKKLFARGQALACAGMLLAGSAAYAFAMLLTYLTGFSEAESMRLASFPRYLGTYPFALCLLFGMVLLRALCCYAASGVASDAASGGAVRQGGKAQITTQSTPETTTNKHQAKRDTLWKSALVAWGVVALLWVLCMPAEQIKQLIPTPEYRSSATMFNEIVREVERRTPSGSSVFVLSQDMQLAENPGFYSLMLQYRMPERDTGMGAVDLRVPQAQHAQQVQALSDTLQVFDFLYLSNVDAACTAVYAPLLGGSKAADKQIYRVEQRKDGAVRLVLMA